MRLYSIFFGFLLFMGFVSFNPIGKFYIEEPLERGKISLSYINIKNNLDIELEKVSTKLFIYDLGLLYYSIPQDIEERDSTTSVLVMPIPEDVTPGIYLARISVGNDNFRDIRHVYVRIR